MAAAFKTAYGLDRAGGQLLVARAGPRGAPQLLLAAAAASAEARRALEDIGREVRQGTAALAVSVPAAQTVVRRLRAPFASAAKAARVWDSLLDVELPFPVESAARAYAGPRAENGGIVAVAAAIRKPELAAFLDACRAEGLDPTHCDAEALALWSQQAAEAPPARAGQPRVVAWLGYTHAAILRGRGGEFLAAHVIRAAPAGADTAAFAGLWAARLPQILGMHLAETGGEELDFWWTGPGAEDETLVAALRKALPAEIPIRHEIHRQPGTLLVRALARRAAEDSGVNFRTGETAHPAVVAAAEKNLRRAYAGVLAAALLVLAVNAGAAVWRRSRAADLQEHLTRAARTIAGKNIPRGQESLMVERAIVRRDGETQPFRDAMDPVGLEGQLARVIEEARALGIEISRLTLTSGALLLEGAAASIQAVEGLSDRLRLQGWLVQSESPGRMPDGRQQFILKGGTSHAE